MGNTLEPLAGACGCSEGRSGSAGEGRPTVEDGFDGILTKMKVPSGSSTRWHD